MKQFKYGNFVIEVSDFKGNASWPTQNYAGPREGVEVAVYRKVAHGVLAGPLQRTILMGRPEKITNIPTAWPHEIWNTNGDL